jgi:hypothetical protein
MSRSIGLCYGVALAVAGSFALQAKTAIPTTWVNKTFVGGPRCIARGPASAFTAPGFESEQEKLGQLGVPVIQAYYRDLPTCQACEVCPNYRREILFEIRTSDAEVSKKAGYNRVAPPDNQELLEYQRGKIYRPPPDVPQEQ